ncbi:MAG: hypothetical protein HWD61_03925 [Parachlamydiaceae bacterium]|nr:MAG: hypothetical protein HWD61_03925 [Parachlamydiaceae bacterium]
MPVQPYSHSVSPIEVNNYHHLKEVSRENCEDGQGRKWTKITYEHSSMWQIGMGFAAFSQP